MNQVALKKLSRLVRAVCASLAGVRVCERVERALPPDEVGELPHSLVALAAQKDVPLAAEVEAARRAEGLRLAHRLAVHEQPRN
eukprot:6192898-Pleurochrysis_carterae.AAC.1